MFDLRQSSPRPRRLIDRVGARRTVLTKWDVMAASAWWGRATSWPRQAGELCVMQGNCAGQQQWTVMSRNLRDGRRARAAETACAAAEAENVKLRRELPSCLCHGLPGELPLC